MSAIIASEVTIRYSAPQGTAGLFVSGTPNGSLGGFASTTPFVTATPGNLFGDITGAQNVGQQVDYRCLFVYNANTANTLVGAVVYLPAEVAGGANTAIAADTTPASAGGSTTPQALTAASATNPGTAIAGLPYTSPTTAGAGVQLGDIPAGYVKAFWVKRTATNSSAVTTDGVTLAVAGDTDTL